MALLSQRSTAVFPEAPAPMMTIDAGRLAASVSGTTAGAARIRTSCHGAVRPAIAASRSARVVAERPVRRLKHA